MNRKGQHNKPEALAYSSIMDNRIGTTTCPSCCVVTLELFENDIAFVIDFPMDANG